ncbi:MAG: DnaA/Hda family protein [Bdellovibrionales bacterium]
MRQLPLPLPHDAAMSADDFLVTPCNKDAAAWIENWPAWPTHGLILTGLAGSGKTHLLNLWCDKSKGRRLTERALLEEDIPALTETTTSLAIDNADVLAGQGKTEEKLFHLYNHLKEVKGFLLLTMTRGVGQAGFVLPDLRSRLLTLPAAALLPPDDTLLEALIIKQFRDRQVTLDVGVVAYLAPRIPRDAAGIRDFVDHLDLAALAEGRKITVALARKILENPVD